MNIFKELHQSYSPDIVLPTCFKYTFLFNVHFQAEQFKQATVIEFYINHKILNHTFHKVNVFMAMQAIFVWVSCLYIIQEIGKFYAELDKKVIKVTFSKWQYYSTGADWMEFNYVVFLSSLSFGHLLTESHFKYSRLDTNYIILGKKYTIQSPLFFYLKSMSKFLSQTSI